MRTGRDNAWRADAGHIWRRRALAFALLLCAGLAYRPALTAAQPRPEPPIGGDPARDASARALFEEGVRLGESGEWRRAEDRFRRALSLRNSPRIAYNLARALYEQGKLVEASEVLRRLEQDERSEPQLMQSVQALQAELAPRIGRVAVLLAREREGDRVWLDGEELVAAQLGVEIPIDPGNHRLSLERDGREIDVQNVEIPAGKTAQLTLRGALAPSPREAADQSQASSEIAASPYRFSAADSGERRDSEPITGRWWFWTAIGVVVAGGAVAVALAATSSGSRSAAAFKGDFAPASIQVQGPK